METATACFKQLAASPKGLALQLLTIGENRLELFTVEVQEERERLLHAFLHVLAVAGFGLLASMTFTAAVVFLLWSCSPVLILLILTAVYASAGFLVARRLKAQLRDWQTLASSLDQLRKDRECLEKALG